MKKVETLLIVIILVIAAQLAYFFLRPKKTNVVQDAKNKYEEKTEKTKHPYDFSGPCPGATEIRKMADGTLRGLIDEGKEYKVILDYYWCNQAQREDIVLFRWSQSQEPVVRKVYAVEGDHFQLTFDKKQKNWNLKINDKLVMDGKAPLGIGGEHPPPLKLFEQTRKGVLGKREIIIFSNPFGTHDSVLLGVVNLNDAVGKVEL